MVQRSIALAAAWMAPLVVLMCVQAPALAQFRRTTELVQKPAVSLVAGEDAYALDVNPAALSKLDGWSIRYVHADADGDAAFSRSGDALYLATPLIGGLALAIGGERLQPENGSGLPSHGVFSFGLSYAANSLFGMGLAVRHAASRAASFDDRTSVDLGFNFTPSSSLGFALLAYDVLAPIDWTGTGDEIDMSALLAVAYRPFGTRHLTMEVAAGADTEGRVNARASAQAAIPYVGEASVSGEFRSLDSNAQRDIRVVAGLDIGWGNMRAGGGVIAGDTLGGKVGWYVNAGIDAQRRGGIPQAKSMTDVVARSTLNERGMIALLRQLEAGLSDAGTSGVLLRLGSTGIHTAHAQEIRWLLDAYNRRGKTTACYLDAATGPEFYACGVAKHRFLDPAGGIRLVGPSLDVMMLGNLLKQVGIRADFIRIGKYKSAPEQWSRKQSSTPARLQREALLDDVYVRTISDFSRDFGKPVEQVAGILDRGPFVGPEAKREGLVHRLLDESQVGEALHASLSAKVRARKSRSAPEEQSWASTPSIGVVVVDGTIVDGENVDIPFLDIHMSGGRTLIETIDRLASERNIKAIVLRIDSPGGSALASDQVWRAVRRARQKKPVIASMGGVAASGGYYIASAAQEIWANPSTVTGSIGVFFGKVDVAQLAEKLDIGLETMRRGSRAGFESLYRPFTADERMMLQGKVGHFYRMFLERVATARGMKVEAVHRVAQGRIWSGDAALRHKLVDRIGGFSAALARARSLAGLPEGAPIQVLPTRPTTLLDYVLGASDESIATKGWFGANVRPGQDSGLPSSETTRSSLMKLRQKLVGNAQLRAALESWLTLAHVQESSALAWMPAQVVVR